MTIHLKTSTSLLCTKSMWSDRFHRIASFSLNRSIFQKLQENSSLKVQTGETYTSTRSSVHSPKDYTWTWPDSRAFQSHTYEPCWPRHFPCNDNTLRNLFRRHNTPVQLCRKYGSAGLSEYSFFRPSFLFYTGTGKFHWVRRSMSRSGKSLLPQFRPQRYKTCIFDNPSYQARSKSYLPLDKHTSWLGCCYSKVLKPR